MTDRDWRLPEYRREAFQRFYSFHLKHRAHPGMVYSMLPAVAELFELDADGRAWLAWLNGNTQNVVTSMLLLEAAPAAEHWRDAVAFWNENFKALEWDTDRRHQKGKFGEATQLWIEQLDCSPARAWTSRPEWDDAWSYARQLPYFGRLSAWSGLEYARILLGTAAVPDAGSWLLHDKSGSQSHRNGVAFVAGYNSVYWDKGTPDLLGIVPRLEAFADDLLAEARERAKGERWAGDVSRLTMESALCTYKSWHKPNRRYPGVYADMMYQRIRKAESRFDRSFDELWAIRRRTLPEYLRLEDNPNDPGLTAVKQNHYLNTGQPIMMAREWPDMDNDFEAAVAAGRYGVREDPTWT